MNAMKRIMFADDEPNILQGLQRMLRPMRREWDMTFAPGGREAWQMLDGPPFDVVLSDMRMPEVNGAQLLAEVMKRHPRTVRIILSGQSDEENILRAVGVAHQYLAKPCDPDTLKATVARACRLRDLLKNERLQEIVSQMTNLPSAPTTFDSVGEQLGIAAPAGNMINSAQSESLADIVSDDIAMSAKTLQLINSAFFGSRREVVNPAVAVQLIGAEALRTLMTAKAFTRHAETSPGVQNRFCIERLHRHSLLTRSLARKIAGVEGMDSAAEECVSSAALLHDIGKLALAAGAPQLYETVLRMAAVEGVRALDAERDVLGATHAEVGAYLAALWGLPDPVVEIIANHHTAGLDPEDSLIGLQTAVVQAANVLAGQLESRQNEPRSAAGDLRSLEGKGLDRRIPAWREFCLATTRPRTRIVPTTSQTPERPNARTPDQLNAQTPEQLNARTPERLNA